MCVWRPLNVVVVSVAGSGSRLIRSPLCASGIVGPCLKSRFSRVPCPKSLEAPIRAISAVEIMVGSWDLPPHMGPKSLEVNPCNLSRWDHRMEVGTYHYTRVPSPQSPEVNPCNLSR